jgi:hypothetical protein
MASLHCSTNAEALLPAGRVKNVKVGEKKPRLPKLALHTGCGSRPMLNLFLADIRRDFVERRSLQTYPTALN